MNAIPPSKIDRRVAECLKCGSSFQIAEPHQCNTLSRYDKFIAQKVTAPKPHGFEPEEVNRMLYEWQKLIARWAIRQGRCALFMDCGLGKTPLQLEWAKQVNEHTGKPVLILAPLAVADQTEREGQKFGVQVNHIREPEEIGNNIYITNYERFERFIPMLEGLGGIILDESSILKSFMGKTRRQLTETCKVVTHRLCCTATPAPNDYMEFGQHAEFLGVMDSNEMLSRWFINDTMNFGTYRLKGHARADFWRWVSTWAACVSLPSDLGFEDGDFKLPPLKLQLVRVAVDQTKEANGELFRVANVNATTMHKELRLTLKERMQAAAKIVNPLTEPCVIWCNTNYEADELIKVVEDAVEIRGSDAPEKKESKLRLFTFGEIDRCITKPEIAGFGLNWQHCCKMIYFPNYSFEQFYQAIRRCYRFGQKSPVTCYVVVPETDNSTLETLHRKIDQHKEMQQEMKAAAKYLRNEHDRQLVVNTGVEWATGVNWKLANGDCFRVVSELPDGSCDFSLYSPPFANLYIYSADAQDMGNCADLEEFFEQYRFLITEKLRITKTGCLTAVHCKNLVRYAGRDGTSGLTDFRGMIIQAHTDAGWTYHSEHVIWKDPVIEMQRTKAQGLLRKQLSRDSRFSRAGMPDYVLLFRKWGEGMEENPVEHRLEADEDWPYFGAEPPTVFNDQLDRKTQIWQRYASPVWMDIRQPRVLNGEIAREDSDEKHICPLQLDVIERLLWLYTRQGDTVLSPFAGIGSEGYCAVLRSRKFIGAELKRAYWQQAVAYIKRAEEESIDLFGLNKKVVA